MTYIMVRLDKWYGTLLQEVWQETVKFVEQEFYRNRLDWVEDLTQSVWNFCIKLYTWKNIENCTVIEKNYEKSM